MVDPGVAARAWASKAAAKGRATRASQRARARAAEARLRGGDRASKAAAERQATITKQKAKAQEAARQKETARQKEIARQKEVARDAAERSTRLKAEAWAKEAAAERQATITRQRSRAMEAEARLRAEDQGMDIRGWTKEDWVAYMVHVSGKPVVVTKRGGVFPVSEKSVGTRPGVEKFYVKDVEVFKARQEKFRKEAISQAVKDFGESYPRGTNIIFYNKSGVIIGRSEAQRQYLSGMTVWTTREPIIYAPPGRKVFYAPDVSSRMEHIIEKEGGAKAWEGYKGKFRKISAEEAKGREKMGLVVFEPGKPAKGKPTFKSIYKDIRGRPKPADKTFEDVVGLARVHPGEALSFEELAIMDAMRRGRKMKELTGATISRIEDGLVKYYTGLNHEKRKRGYKIYGTPQSDAKRVADTLRAIHGPFVRTGKELIQLGHVTYEVVRPRNWDQVAKEGKHLVVDVRKKVAYISTHKAETTRATLEFGKKFTKAQITDFKRNPYKYSGRVAGELAVMVILGKAGGRLYTGRVGAPARVAVKAIKLPISKAIKYIPKPKFTQGVKVVGQKVWAGGYVSIGGDAYPLLGRAGGKWVLGQPGKLVRVDKKLLQKFLPTASRIEAKIMSHPDIIIRAGYGVKGVERVGIAMKLRGLGDRGIGWRKFGLKLSRESTIFTKTEANKIISITKGLQKKGVVEQIYGSFPTQAQLKRKFRRLWGDVDIQLKVGDAETAEIARFIASKMGRGFKVDPRNPSIVLKYMGKVKGRDRWVHAVDLHSKNIPIKDILAPGFEGAIGRPFGRPSIKAEGLPVMQAGEQFHRKLGASTIWGGPGKGQIGPMPHRWKDVPDVYAIGRSLLRFDGRLLDRKYRKLLERWKRAYSEANWGKSIKQGGVVKVPLLSKGQMKVKVSGGLVPYMSPSTKVSLSPSPSAKQYTAVSFLMRYAKSYSRSVTKVKPSRKVSVPVTKAKLLSKPKPSKPTKKKPKKKKVPPSKPSPKKKPKKPSPKIPSPKPKKPRKPSPKVPSPRKPRVPYQPRPRKAYVPIPRWKRRRQREEEKKRRRRRRVRRKYRPSIVGIEVGARAPPKAEHRVQTGIGIRGEQPTKGKFKKGRRRSKKRRKRQRR